jgi:excisionase family DNA binding protein
MSDTHTVGLSAIGGPMQGKPLQTQQVSAEKMLTRSEVARILGVSPTTVTRWAREGRLACRMTLGGHHRFSPSLIEQIRTQMSKKAGS